MPKSLVKLKSMLSGRPAGLETDPALQAAEARLTLLGAYLREIMPKGQIPRMASNIQSADLGIDVPALWAGWGIFFLSPGPDKEFEMFVTRTKGFDAIEAMGDTAKTVRGLTPNLLRLRMEAKALATPASQTPLTSSLDLI